MSQTKGLQIRAANSCDLDVVQQIGCDTYREHFAGIWTPAGMQHFLDLDFSPSTLRATLDDPASHLWLLAADANGSTVGFAKLNWATPAPLCGRVGAELQKIYLLKSAAGKGYGEQLLHFIFNCAIERDQRLIWLDVLKSNIAAQRFYEKFGFRQLGEIPFKTDLAQIGMRVMARDL